ncbi:MAG: SDR family oxidoreductase [Spirochaetes bacterium]|nr:SDR family oxidoreductase [Spirochaetota bacterium]
MYDFSGKIVAVTGAAKGLGYAIAQRFLKEKAKGVALLDLNEDALLQAQKALDAEKSRSFVAVCDVGDYASVEKAFGDVTRHFGPVDILINNAGITMDSFAAKMTAQQFDKTVLVSLNGSFYCARQVIPGMREKGWGRIISLSSTSAFGNVGQVNYSSAKAGLIGFTSTLALELGPKGITANCVAPGFIDTDMIKSVPANVMEELLKRNPAGRLGKPEEVANLVIFLASDEAAYINGECIKICGGFK